MGTIQKQYLISSSICLPLQIFWYAISLEKVHLPVFPSHHHKKVYWEKNINKDFRQLSFMVSRSPTAFLIGEGETNTITGKTKSCKLYICKVTPNASDH